MRDLPQFVRRLPYVFYALAVVLGLWRLWNDWTVVSETYQYAEAGGVDFGAVSLLGRSTALYWGISEAAYMVANGAVIHVLIAIFDRLKGASE